MLLFRTKRHLPEANGRTDSTVAVPILALALLFGATQVPAMSLRELKTLEKQEKQGSNYVLYYLVGAMEGLMEAERSESVV